MFSHIYNWSLTPNNNRETVSRFSAGGLSYSYVSKLTGKIKLRRVNIAMITGNFSLVWAESVLNDSNINLLPAYQNNMENFYDSSSYNKGTDNTFGNTTGNSNIGFHALFKLPKNRLKKPRIGN